MKTTQKTFKTANSSNRFRARLNDEPKTQDKPRFAKQKPYNNNAKRSHQPKATQVQRTETTLSSANGQNAVSVMVKRTEEAPYQKKTGPLSPRAPEKIKNNRLSEMKVYGEKACLTLFKTRPESIIRAWSTVAMSHKIGEMFSYLATNKKAYHVVSHDELTKASGSEHHGGLCLLVKKPRTLTLSGYLDIPHKQDALLMIDQVANAYNLGGILRTAFIYGISGVISKNVAQLYNPAAIRVAEGAMEYIRPLETPHLKEALHSLREQGYQIVHLNPNAVKTPMHKVQFAKKVVFVLSEKDAHDLIEHQDLQINLTPTNALQSTLNLSVATGILLSHWGS